MNKRDPSKQWRFQFRELNERMGDMGRKTLLWPVHLASGAQMAEFAGWDMPIRYADIQAEHKAVRTAAGLFDVSHMGELRITGPGALAFADYLITNKVADPQKRRATYSPMCHPDGGTVDDLFVYVCSPEEVLLVVNAGNIEKDEAHIRSLLPNGLVLANESDEWLQFALQGPAAAAILAGMEKFARCDAAGMKFMSWVPAEVDGFPAILSRSGYTGGDGYEIYVRCGSDAGWAAGFWNELLDEGKAYGIVPVGLGARDTLRLEGALSLYGHELTDAISPVEANLLRFIHLGKEDFVGKTALKAQVENGTTHVLAGLILIDRGIAREGCLVFPPLAENTPGAGDSTESSAPYVSSASTETQNRLEDSIGRVTSGGVGITIGRNIAMALLKRSYSVPGMTVLVDVRGRRLKAEVTALPFYRKPGR
jgi:aminomethyltransferase